MIAAVEFLEPTASMAYVDTEESFDQMVERIAREWIAQPCPEDEQAYCNPEMHVWETMHPEDQAHALDFVRFALTRAGLE